MQRVCLADRGSRKPTNSERSHLALCCGQSCLHPTPSHSAATLCPSLPCVNTLSLRRHLSMLGLYSTTSRAILARKVKEETPQ